MEESVVVFCTWCENVIVKDIYVEDVGDRTARDIAAEYGVDACLMCGSTDFDFRYSLSDEEAENA